MTEKPESRFNLDRFFEPYECVESSPNGSVSRSRFYKYVIPKLVAKNKPVFVIETGSFHSSLEDNGGAFTYVMGDLIKNWTGGKLYTVDNNIKHIEKCKELTQPFSEVIEYVHSDSLLFLKDIAGAHQWDLIYLDSMDLDLLKPLESSSHHLGELNLIYDYCGEDTIIGVDDNYEPHTTIEWFSDYGPNKDTKVLVETGENTVGKGAYIDPFLIEKGWYRHTELDEPFHNNVYCYER